MMRENAGAVVAVESHARRRAVEVVREGTVQPRKDEIRRLRRATAPGRPPTQVLTAVRGWPGVGKTTLARAVAHSPDMIAAFPDGVLWASLGPVPAVLAELITWGRMLRDEQVVTARTAAE